MKSYITHNTDYQKRNLQSSRDSVQRRGWRVTTLVHHQIIISCLPFVWDVLFIHSQRVRVPSKQNRSTRLEVGAQYICPQETMTALHSPFACTDHLSILLARGPDPIETQASCFQEDDGDRGVKVALLERWIEEPIHDFTQVHLVTADFTATIQCGTCEASFCVGLRVALTSIPVTRL